jgi:hypothetical protein
MRYRPIKPKMVAIAARNKKKVILSKNFAWQPYVKVFQKTQKCFLNDKHQIKPEIS